MQIRNIILQEQKIEIEEINFNFLIKNKTKIRKNNNKRGSMVDVCLLQNTL